MLMEVSLGEGRSAIDFTVGISSSSDSFYLHRKLVHFVRTYSWQRRLTGCTGVIL